MRWREREKIEFQELHHRNSCSKSKVAQMIKGVLEGGVAERKKVIVTTKLPKLLGRREKKFNRNCDSQVVEVGVEKKKICGNEVAEN